MKRILLIALALSFNFVHAQSAFWVALTDKAGTTFDPYSYFDAKAIERYKINNANLYDITNYPLNDNYVQQIDAIATEDFGQSRWLNAVAVIATPDQIGRIAKLPFVKEIVPLDNNMLLAEKEEQMTDNEEVAAKLLLSTFNSQLNATVTNQLHRMQGQRFVDAGFDGKGIRIAVFDGGFKAVNTHQAFKHLRDNGQIIATWNFTNKTADVYDNHSHGTMVLSCIAGRMGNRLLGLATGATFLLAKTEVDPEPFKEEVWWAQAVEWADKNGADIINSSLGYTNDRHYTWQMDGRSYVSKAANLAARKGILVCNSAGNSGGDEDWKIIGAPADADSILSVGGINPSLKAYNHISFSSYGPTADGRMKPNVCNFGYAECADSGQDTATTYAAGTSFSSPLTTGFCACAMQVVRNQKLTAMQMKSMIEQSADLYPYYDYAFGYGVPQASYFLDEAKRIIEPAATFSFENYGEYIIIRPKANASANWQQEAEGLDNGDLREDAVLFKIQNSNGVIERYYNLGLIDINDSLAIAIHKSYIADKKLVACVNGFTNEFKLPQDEQLDYDEEDNEKDPYYLIDYETGRILSGYNERGARHINDNYVSNWGVGQKYLGEVYLQYGINWFFPYTMRYSDAYNVGFRFIRNFRKWYGLGFGFDVTDKIFRYDPATADTWDNTLAITDFTNIDRKRYFSYDVNLELFQRIRLIKKGNDKKGLHWDLGVYGGLHGNNYTVQYNAAENNDNAYMQTNTYSEVEPASNWNWGLTSRLVWNWIGVYGRYRMSQPSIDLPRLELGIQISF
ncbi:MAG: S8 family serine peptidase [Bacteroidales bacterium]|nr:S8 family serine peptidase [Bacteroidales bacterium]